MIQTVGRRQARDGAVHQTSQSSIRPGDDSDGFCADGLVGRRSGGRNPVFALEMIQTNPTAIMLSLAMHLCRNPVFALEMIQTGLVRRYHIGVTIDVAIQYSPWR